MSTDTIKTIATYVIAILVILGGGLLLVLPSQVPPEQLLPFLTGIVGTVVGYVFSERSSASATASAVKLTGTPTSDGSTDNGTEGT